MCGCWSLLFLLVLLRALVLLLSLLVGVLVLLVVAIVLLLLRAPTFSKTVVLDATTRPEKG